jgi:hypothetical protein
VSLKTCPQNGVRLCLMVNSSARLRHSPWRRRTGDQGPVASANRAAEPLLGGHGVSVACAGGN